MVWVPRSLEFSLAPRSRPFWFLSGVEALPASRRCIDVVITEEVRDMSRFVMHDPRDPWNLWEELFKLIFED